jgi:hypothetical protein
MRSTNRINMAPILFFPLMRTFIEEQAKGKATAFMTLLPLRAVESLFYGRGGILVRRWTQ